MVSRVGEEGVPGTRNSRSKGPEVREKLTQELEIQSH